MTDLRYPLSPPSSTSLPEHWAFYPPETDGPNTRARIAAGLQPLSGTAVPLSAAGKGREVRDTNPWTASAPEAHVSHDLREVQSM